MDKRLLVVFSEEEKTHNVEFTGVWTRLDLDRAFIVAFKQLPAHLRDVRQEMMQKELTLKEKE